MLTMYTLDSTTSLRNDGSIIWLMFVCVCMLWLLGPSLVLLFSSFFGPAVEHGGYTMLRDA